MRETSDNIETESIYGSEFGTDDENTLSHILLHAESQRGSKVDSAIVQESSEISDDRIQVAYEDHGAFIADTPRTRNFIDERGISFQAPAFNQPLRQASVEIEYHARNRVAFSRKLPTRYGLGPTDMLTSALSSTTRARRYRPYATACGRPHKCRSRSRSRSRRA